MKRGELKLGLWLGSDKRHVELHVAEDDELKLSPLSIGKLELSPSPP